MRARAAAAILVTLCVVMASGMAAPARRARKDAVRAPVPAAPGRARVERWLDASLDSLDQELAGLEHADAPRRRSAFRAARAAYKRLEGAIEYYSPTTAAALNAPAAEETGDEQTSGKTEPRGFQRLEPAVFLRADERAWRAGRAEIVRMRRAVRGLRGVTGYVAAAPAELKDAARLELGRVSTLGIAGFDAPFSADAILEASAALSGLRELLAAGFPGEAGAAISALDSAAGFLRAHPDFVRFDRLRFVTGYATPAFRAIAALPIPPGAPVALRRAWPLAVSSIYDARGFDPGAYAPADAPRPTPVLLALGRDLFFDPLLSGNGQRACASCHVPERSFADGRPRALPFAGAGEGATRHTPSLVDAAFAPAYFADERAGTLEDQVAVVLASPNEMRSSVTVATERLGRSAEYRRRFAVAFAGRGAGITPRMVQLAIAAYVRSLTAFDSRFDRAARGDTAALDTEERRGFNLFMGKAGCGTCHFAPLFSGTAPPDFTASEVEVIGAPRRPETRGVVVDPDSGRAGVDHLPVHLHAFKTPTVRNAALTGPYMHNGVFPTLDGVLAFYDRGGGAGLGVPIPNQTLSPRRLRLTPGERRAVIAFLRALADTTGLTARPTRLPPLDLPAAGPERPVGGRY